MFHELTVAQIIYNTLQNLYYGIHLSSSLNVNFDQVLKN